VTVIVGAAFEPCPAAGQHCYENGGEYQRETGLDTLDGRIEPRRAVVSEGNYQPGITGQLV
jgi:hypothetical protein